MLTAVDRNVFSRPVIVLTVLAIACAVLRLKTYSEPFDNDLTGYAVMAHQMLEGKRLYDDIWDHKPPAIHVSYMVAEWIAGYGERSIYLLNVVVSVITLLGVYSAGHILAGAGGGGLLAAGLWTVVSMEPTSQANQPNTEVFINACQAWTLAVWMRYADRLLPFRVAALLGALTMVATFYKNVAIVPAVLAGIAYVCIDRTDWVSRLERMALAGGTVLLGWFMMLGYFASQGRENAFVECVMQFNSAYMRPIGETVWESFEPKSLVFAMVAAFPAMLAFCLSDTSASARARWCLFAAFCVGIHGEVSLPGFFHWHYYQFWLPVLCVSFAGLWSLLTRLPGPHPRFSAAAVCAALFLVIGVPYVKYLALWDANQWSAHKFKGEFIITKATAQHVRQLLEPEETLFQWGNQTGFYFYCGRNPLSRLFYVHPLFVASSSPQEWARQMAGKLGSQMTEEVVKARPDLIIIPRAEATMYKAQIELLPKGSLLEFLMREYEPLPGINPESFYMLMARPRSGLMQRASAADSSNGAPSPKQP